jgi:hypothetical protein
MRFPKIARNVDVSDSKLNKTSQGESLIFALSVVIASNSTALCKLITLRNRIVSVDFSWIQRPELGILNATPVPGRQREHINSADSSIRTDVHVISL